MACPVRLGDRVTTASERESDSDQLALASVLQGLKGIDAATAANALFSYFGSAGLALSASVEDQARVAGDVAVAFRLRAIRHLMLLSLRSDIEERPQLRFVDKLVDYLRLKQGFDGIEQFRLLHLDVAQKLIREDVVARGEPDRVDVSIREIIRLAIAAGSRAIILVHNHPSGDPTPSRADKDFTRRVISAAHPIGIKVADHLILSRNACYSFSVRESW